MDNQTDIEKFSAEDRKKIVDEQEKKMRNYFKLEKIH
jgi:energy-converting hydrogenase Eha subunit H